MGEPFTSFAGCQRIDHFEGPALFGEAEGEARAMPGVSRRTRRDAAFFKTDALREEICPFLCIAFSLPPFLIAEASEFHRRRKALPIFAIRRVPLARPYGRVTVYLPVLLKTAR
jgi:hypothetical protein